MTSRKEKLWPDEHWRELIATWGHAGLSVLVPWGSERERERSVRLVAGEPSAIVPPRQSLAAIASLLAHAEIVVGVDTGLTHLSAALGTPTVALFTTTDATLAGVAIDGSHAIDLGGNGIVPAVEDARAACAALMRTSPRC